MRNTTIGVAQKIKKELRKVAKHPPKEKKDFIHRYLGTDKIHLGVRAADRDKLLRQLAKEMKEMPANQAIAILDKLFCSDTFEHLNFAGKFLTTAPTVRKQLKLSQVEKWVRKTKGWAECDGLCQSLFTEGEVLERWNEWEKVINKFSKDKNIQVRRSSLVLQVKPVRRSSNAKLRKLAFKTVEKLKSEKDILITKAISWLLRALSNEGKTETKKYLQANKESLPRIAFRETIKKIETGKK